MTPPITYCSPRVCVAWRTPQWRNHTFDLKVWVVWQRRVALEVRFEYMTSKDGSECLFPPCWNTMSRDLNLLLCWTGYVGQRVRENSTCVLPNIYCARGRILDYDTSIDSWFGSPAVWGPQWGEKWARHSKLSGETRKSIQNRRYQDDPRV
jgi:hypothetical protein